MHTVIFKQQPESRRLLLLQSICYEQRVCAQSVATAPLASASLTSSLETFHDRQQAVLRNSIALQHIQFISPFHCMLPIGVVTCLWLLAAYHHHLVHHSRQSIF